MNFQPIKKKVSCVDGVSRDNDFGGKFCKILASISVIANDISIQLRNVMTSERGNTGDNDQNHSKSMSSHSCGLRMNDEAFNTNKMDAEFGNQLQLLGSVGTPTPSTNLSTENRLGHEKPSKKALVKGVEKHEKSPCGKQLIYSKYIYSSSCEAAVGPSSSYGDENGNKVINDNVEGLLLK